MYINLEWDSSWLTWNPKTGLWNSWTDYMFMDLTTSLCQFCPEEEYFNPTTLTCNCKIFKFSFILAWESSWTGGWMYRLQWFQWSSSQIFSLQTFSWVQNCEIDEILIDSDKIHGLKVWRKLIYFVNSHSEEILELGTREFPYKSINMVIHELFNFVSGLDQEVIVKLSSASYHEFAHGSSFIYNMKKVVFEPYNINIKNFSTGIEEFGREILNQNLTFW